MADFNTNTYTGASFSLQNRLARLVWGVAYIVFFRYSPKPFHGWRSFILKIFGAKVGKNVHVYPAVKIWAPWNLELGDECGVANGVDLYSQGKITLGYRSIVSQRSYICSGTHDYTKKGHPLVTAPITIGAHAWVAAEVFIHPGVTIGEGAVIGARAVVNKNMPAWTVCAGHPCKPLKERVITD
ncbi:putative colanic acid biosynthesis acetyltransferase [Flavobacterium sp. Sd200]|uniref:putative colanic acid biosynthesis acetyltransferase n=1 Tax=Flavobacterium sp. Sd200 TaxID=2692211 RepID=UPI0013683C75|nr:putative colanic acid biosynthesis acetyltransferase [Flavobacterium sp. Sd200]MXN91976.1 putative colanic acid biosynthesis acetyltransferase [Flavobacterium sp. Sd200]